MRRKTSTIYALFLLCIVSALTACSPPEVKLNCNFKEIPSNRIPSKEIVVVLSPSDKFVEMKSAIALAKNEIAQLVTDEDAKISVVIGDGSPRLIVNRVIETSGQLVETGRKQKVDDALEILDRINRCIDQQGENYFAVVSEIDVLGAIQKGGISFSSEATDKYLFVVGNGLQTKGAFNFKKGLNADESANDQTVNDLIAKNNLGDLSGVKVTWIGLGQTRQGTDQQALDENARSILVSLWKKIITAAGGDSVGIVPGDVGEGDVATGGIPTSVVPFSAVKACIEPIVIGEDDGFEFLPNTTNFENQDLARATASRIAEQLNSASCTDGVVVTGYVASGGSPEGCARTPGFEMELSLGRANAFKTLLEDSGVTMKISPKAGGLGPVPDCIEGKGVETLMKQNRIAKITARQ